MPSGTEFWVWQLPSVRWPRWIARRVLATFAAIAGATLLDADKPAMYFWRKNPFPRAVRRIHTWAQNESPEGMPNEILFGVSCALADAVIAVQSRRRVLTP